MNDKVIINSELEENEIDLEIIELEDKVAPRDWNVYAIN